MFYQQLEGVSQSFQSESESSLIIMWRFLGYFSWFAPSTTLRVNEQPSVSPIVAPENRPLADAVSGVTAGLSKALGLVLLANAVNASISCRGAGVMLNVL